MNQFNTGSRFKFIIYLISFQTLLFIPLSGQDDFPNLRSQVRTLELRNIGPKKYNEIDGTPYYTDKYIKSVAYLKNGNYASIPLRYDLFQDEMEFIKENNVLWLVKKDIKYIRYGSDMIFLSSPDGDTSKLAYYFLKDEGKIMLFYKIIIRYQPYIEPKGYTSAIPESFVPDKNLIYIKREKMPACKIVTKKDLTSFFSEDEIAMEFIKKNKIRPDNIEDLHSLVSFLNSR